MVIGDAPLVLGLELAGIEDTIQVSDNQFQNELESALTKSEYGIIVTNERLLSSIDWKLKKKLNNLAYPVIVPIPDYSGTSTEGDEIRGLIKRALGFDLGKK